MKKSEMAITIEQLAAEEHKQWAAWATDILNTEVVSSQRAARWVELIQTEYENLSEEMKELDRREVRLHVLPIIDRLMQENQQLKEQIIKYKRSIEIGDDR